MGKGRRSRESRPPEVKAPSLAERLERLVATVRERVARLSKRTRVAVVIVPLVIAAGLFFLLQSIPAEQTVELELKADQGESSFQLVAETDAVSPGCGCPEPAQGEQHWQGMSIPSTGFDLNVETRSASEVANDLWSLTVFAPNTGPMDWHAMPNHSIWMYVDLFHADGSLTTLYAGPTNHLLIWSDETVSVHQPRRNPYAAILPASGGTTSFTSQEAPRAQQGARVDLASTSPARPPSAIDRRGYWRDPDLTQRGPMVDLLGPAVRFTLPYTDRTRIWAASREIGPPQRGDRLVIGVSTPFALRLIPHPVEHGWQSLVSKDGPPTAKDLLGEVASSPGRGTLEEPVGRDRIPLKQALPPFEMQLSDIQTPSQDLWTSFAERSERQKMVWAMMGKTRLDPLDSAVYRWNEYALPPVTTRPQIGVFGRIQEFDSTSVSGEALVDSGSRAIPRGERVRFSSSKGLATGAYRLTPLVSVGQETAEASISGEAKVWIGGDLVSHLDFLSLIPFSALLWTMLGVLLAESYRRWIHRES